MIPGDLKTFGKRRRKREREREGERDSKEKAKGKGNIKYVICTQIVSLFQPGNLMLLLISCTGIDSSVF